MTVHANSHTHCQVTQADPQAKTWQRVYLFQRTTDRQSERKKNTERTTAVWRNGGCSASYDSFVVGSSAVLRLNFSAKNLPLRQAVGRYVQCLTTK
jgi:hypothetical protein